MRSIIFTNKLIEIFFDFGFLGDKLVKITYDLYVTPPRDGVSEKTITPILKTVELTINNAQVNILNDLSKSAITKIKKIIDEKPAPETYKVED